MTSSDVLVKVSTEGWFKYHALGEMLIPKLDSLYSLRARLLPQPPIAQEHNC